MMFSNVKQLPMVSVIQLGTAMMKEETKRESHGRSQQTLPLVVRLVRRASNLMPCHYMHSMDNS
jgi:hypothetical protein